MSLCAWKTMLQKNHRGKTKSTGLGSKSMKIKLVVFSYFALLLFLNPVQSNSTAASQTRRTSTPDPLADIHELVNNVMKEDAEFKFQLGVARAALKLLPKIGVLRVDMDIFQKLANKTFKSLACAKVFRYRMDVFGIEFGHGIGKKLQSSPALTTALNNIKKALKQRSSIIDNGADMLATLYQKYSDNTFSFNSPSQQLSAWRGKAKFAYRTLRTINITVNQRNELPKYPNIGNLVMQIYSASDEESAVMLFQKQCESYYWKEFKYVYHEDYPELKKLATHLPKDEETDVIDNFNSNNKANLESEDIIFLHDLLKCSTFYVKNNKRYEGCVKVFYYAPSQRIELLKDDLEKKWPNLDFPFRVDRFCDAFTTLYDMLSAANIHALPDDYIITYDEDSMYVYNFIRKIVGAKYRIDDFIVVGQVLGKISFDFIAPTTPTCRNYAEYNQMK